MNAETSISRTKAHCDVLIAEIARWQYGVIALHQLVQLGLSKSAVRSRVAEGRLHRVERGVFSLAPPQLLSPSGWAMAAVLAAGPSALLSHAWAGWWWGLRKRPGGRVQVSRPGAGVRSRRSVVIHGTTTLHPDERRLHERMPVTSIARTLLDQAAGGGYDDLSNQIDTAIELQLYDHREVEALLARHPQAPGTPLLRQILSVWTPAPFTRSDGEKALHRLIRDGGLPLPQVNAQVLGYERDFWWPEQRLVVEYDGWDAHKTRAQQEVDRIRDASLAVERIPVLRITGLRLQRDPAWVLDTIGRGLGA